MTFRVWMRNFTKDDTAVGDLARDIVDDANFPKTNDYDLMLNHLKSCNACDDAIQVLKEAWFQYEIEIKRDPINKI